MFYKLNIVQQPTVARMSTSPKDKRLLNPPLVLRLDCSENERVLGPNDVPDFDLYYCFATLIQTEESRYVDLDSELKTDQSHTHLLELIGSPLSKMYKLWDDKGHTGCFFVYPDLGIRLPGVYRLLFQVFKIDLFTNSSPILTTLYSQDIAVVPPKEYPGNDFSSALTRCFKNQGVPFHVNDGRLRKKAPK